MVLELACVVPDLLFQLHDLFLQGPQFIAALSGIEALPMAEGQPSCVCSCCEEEELGTHYNGLDEQLSGG